MHAGAANAWKRARQRKKGKLRVKRGKICWEKEKVREVYADTFVTVLCSPGAGRSPIRQMYLVEPEPTLRFRDSACVCVPACGCPGWRGTRVGHFPFYPGAGREVGTARVKPHGETNNEPGARNRNLAACACKITSGAIKSPALRRRGQAAWGRSASALWGTVATAGGGGWWRGGRQSGSCPPEILRAPNGAGAERNGAELVNCGSGSDRTVLL